jgi:hypothetical protein
MTPDLPLSSSRAAEIVALLDMLTCVLQERSAVYVSSPITSGREYSKWLLTTGHPSPETNPDYFDQFRRFVVEPNRQRARIFVRNLRQISARVVIDPSALHDFPGWTQEDYRFLWGRAIERYADTVVFREGWQFSSGCSYEFLVACLSRAETLREDLTPLSLDEGRSLIASAIAETPEGKALTFLKEVYQGLDSLLSHGRYDA